MPARLLEALNRPREALWLSQSEIAGNEEHHNNNTNDVENVHVSSSFFSRDRITLEPDAHNIIQRKGKREASVVVLPSDAVP